jgi:MAF protein
MNDNPLIILATGSKHRITAFEDAGFKPGIDFVTEASKVDEKQSGRPREPAELVCFLAKLKAEAILPRVDAILKKHGNSRAAIVIGSDSIGYHRGRILEKPEGKTKAEKQANAFKRLRKLSGETHSVYTCVYMIRKQFGVTQFLVEKEIVETDITFRPLTPSEINRYLKSDPNYSSRGLGYNTSGGLSMTFIRRLAGSPSELSKGTPMGQMMEMLKRLGYSLEP